MKQQQNSNEDYFFFEKNKKKIETHSTCENEILHDHLKAVTCPSLIYDLFVCPLFDSQHTL